ncbi:MAG: helix-turn-helix transcriptional regulator [Fuerstiella sp.]
MSGLFTQVRSLIEDCGDSRYSISKATGISQPQLSSFMAGEKGIGPAALEKLLDYLGYEIRVVKKRKSK